MRIVTCALINDILDLSRIESGTMEFMFANHNLPLLLKTVHDSQQLNMPPRVELLLRMPDNEKKYLVTDNVRLQQVVNNLINNAAKFTTYGSITFGYEEDEDPEYTRIFVEDTGVGISEEGIRHIFERFYKVDQLYTGSRSWIEYLPDDCRTSERNDLCDFRSRQGNSLYCTYPEFLRIRLNVHFCA